MQLRPARARRRAQQCLKSGMTRDHDERVRPRGRVNRPGEQHEPGGKDLGQGVDPQRVAETLVAHDADQRPSDVSTEERTVAAPPVRVSGRRGRRSSRRARRAKTGRRAAPRAIRRA
jgi:hypothetical protein